MAGWASTELPTAQGCSGGVIDRFARDQCCDAAADRDCFEPIEFEHGLRRAEGSASVTDAGRAMCGH
jgi:hypothetical protein